ncbi:MAG: ionic transporter y4hA [Burkholderiales bacterium]|nr:ionic transporter y4hA [Burkholderiales bacterium]
MPRWALLIPIAAVAVLAAGLAMPSSGAVLALAVVALVAAVFAAVHHAEVVAHRVGEPFGTLVLALAVTVIEVALIVSMMLAGGPDKATLPRDTIFAAIMIICNGVMGICLLVGGIRHREQLFRVEGATTGFGALIALAALSLVLPSFTVTSAGPTYTESQLAFAGIASLVLWAVFAFFQTVRHRQYFLAVGASDEGEDHGEKPSTRLAWASFTLLLVSLVAVIGLAKVLSPSIESGIAQAGAPKAVVGIAIAMLVLMPETWAAVRAARADRVQTSLNLAIGSALASIGLTIPAVAATSVLLDLPLVLGLEAKDLVLLLTTFLVGAITLGTGRTNIMQGAVHLVIFAAFLFLALVP